MQRILAAAIFLSSNNHPPTPIPQHDLERIAQAIALTHKHNIDPLLLLAIAWKESQFRIRIRGAHKEYGLFQINPSNLPKDIHEDIALDPYINTSLATELLARYLRQCKDMSQALAAYNGGPCRVGKYGKAVLSIRKRLRRFEKIADS